MEQGPAPSLFIFRAKHPNVWGRALWSAVPVTTKGAISYGNIATPCFLA